MRKFIVVGIAAIFGAQCALGQTLTRAQEGRMAVGQCYSACLQGRDGTGPIAWLALYWDNWRDSEFWSDQEWDGFVALWQSTGCAATQEEVIALYTCGQGCIDVERAYGVNSSFARNAFRHELAEGTAALRAAGLWNTNNRNSPDAGSAAFARACTAFFASGSAASGRGIFNAYKGAYQAVDKLKRTWTANPKDRLRPPDTMRGARP